ncbi:MAG: tryptophan synthase subunit alpha [Acidobacteria bacterium 21-70-11]|nr:MAG: tryptophan synthase subunit alpha [Acidobacteria bacterium 21-70-11]
MSGRIEKAFLRARKARRAAFIPYITAGDPAPARTVVLARALERAGADILELGVPFTDPIADGPTNQRAAERALAQGTSLTGVLGLVRELRFSSELPVVLFTYFNPVHAYGLARFAVDAAAAGVDGVLFTDVPVEEAMPAHEALRRVGVELVLLLAPTSTRERVKAVRKLAGSFVYFVARAGVTGARAALEEGLEEQVRLVRKLTKTRVAVGFGVSTPEHVARIAHFADGVVVGSVLVDRIGELGDVPELPGEVEALARSFAVATRRR